MRNKQSEYMHWAKTRSVAPFNLATSGVGAFPFSELPFDAGMLAINGDNSYGYPPLVRAIAARHGVDPDCVVEAEGTSMANYLAMAAILEPGEYAYCLSVDGKKPIKDPFNKRVKKVGTTFVSAIVVPPAASR